jgi:CRISPR-associated protein Cas2
MTKKKKPLTFAENMLRLYRSGLPADAPLKKPPADAGDEIPSIEVRVQTLLGLINNKQDNRHMLFFVMYDIENDKVRRQVVKYLLRKGCMRVQKSIFVGDREHKIYAEIKDDLAAVQACYDNEDSILVLPISTDYLQAMRIIGKSIDLDIVLKNKNTLFF